MQYASTAAYLRLKNFSRALNPFHRPTRLSEVRRLLNTEHKICNETCLPSRRGLKPRGIGAGRAFSDDSIIILIVECVLLIPPSSRLRYNGGFASLREEAVVANVNRFSLMGLTVCALVLSGCATQAYPPLPATATTGQADYLIGPGDNVNIVVWRNPEVSLSVPVRPDGKITTPLVEDLPASGKTPTVLARDIEKALAKYIQDPVVTVIVTGFVGPYDKQIRVIGQAAKPQALPYRDRMTLMDVLIAVGGITDFADGNKASILRVVDGRPQQFGVRLNDLIKDGKMAANVDMLPGDVLIVPESWF